MKNTRSANHFFLAILFISAVLVFFVFKPYLAPLILGAALAVVFFPLANYFSKAFWGNRTVGSLLTTLLVLFIVLLPATFYGIKIVQEAGQAYSAVSGSSLGNVFSSVAHSIQKYVPWLPSAESDIQNYFRNGLDIVLNNFGAVFSGVADLFISFLLSLITLYVILKNGDSIRKKMLQWSPLPEKMAEEIIEKVRRAVSSVIKGTLVMSIIQGIVAGIGFVIFNVPQPMIWALACVFAGLIPFVGSGLITIPAAIYLFLAGAPLAGVGMLLWGVLLVGTMDNILRPFLMEKGVDAHPLLILLSALGGISFFGAIGFLVGPVLTTLIIALLDIYPRVAVAD